MTTENEDVTKGKRKRTRTAHYVAGEHMHAHMRDHHAVTPQHEAAQGHQDVMEASCGKASGNPVDHVHSPSGSYDTDRVSAPLTAGRAASSPGNPRSQFDRSDGGALAIGHPDMRQQTTTVLPWQTLRSVNGDNQFGDRDITHPTGTATVRQLQVQHGEQFTSNPSGNPNVRGADHSARNSATPQNGSHVAGGNVTSNKSSPLDIMKAALSGDRS
jgi:hypothetical protein